MDVVQGNRQIIAIEEHYWDRELASHFSGRDAQGSRQLEARLFDLGELRIKEMDEAGIDVQVLSHGAPAVQKLSDEIAVRMAQSVNDRLHSAIQANPKRLAAFATVPTIDGSSAAAELERSVTKLGFKGAMVHGLANGAFLDQKRFWPLFERAQELDVPIYLHPSQPNVQVAEIYYGDYIKDFPQILTAGWGFTVECATQALRMILSGVFDTYPKLKIIVGHLGETLPFLTWRMENSFARPPQNFSRFREVFTEHFYITTSGNFSTPGVLCSMMELGADRILFAVDWPYVENTRGTDWIGSAPLSPEDRSKILSGNAKRLLRL